MLILPLPRDLVPESSAEGRVVFLSPGRVSYPEQHVHYIVAHEIGHVVQHLLMPESRRDLWKRYGTLRGLDFEFDDGSTPHAWRPTEVFAEDFRVLFGGESARCGGNVENHDIVPPEEVLGLREFMLSLPGEWDGRVRLSAFPNPFEAGVVFQAFDLGDENNTVEVEVFDIQGRAVTNLRASAKGTCLVVWDGTDREGRAAAPGVYFAVVRCGRDSVVRKLIKRK
jgi:hypothetical protein